MHRKHGGRASLLSGLMVMAIVIGTLLPIGAVGTALADDAGTPIDVDPTAEPSPVPTALPADDPTTEPTAATIAPTDIPTGEPTPTQTSEPAVVAADVVPAPVMLISPYDGPGDSNVLESPYIVPANYYVYATALSTGQVGYFEDLTCAGEPDDGWRPATSPLGARSPLAFQRLLDGERSACIVVTWAAYIPSAPVPVPAVQIRPLGGSWTELASPYVVPAGYEARALPGTGGQVGSFENLTCEGEPDNGWKTRSPEFGTRAPLAFQTLRRDRQDDNSEVDRFSPCIVVTWAGYVPPPVPVPVVQVSPGPGHEFTELPSPYVVPANYFARVMAPDGGLVGSFGNLTCEGDPDAGWETRSPNLEMHPPLAFQTLLNGVRSACIVVTWASNNTPTPTQTTVPTNTPTAIPTSTPTNTPTAIPTNTPTNTPTNVPTNTPTTIPTNTPTTIPTNTPTVIPTTVPTNTPTASRAVITLVTADGGAIPDTTRVCVGDACQTFGADFAAAAVTGSALTFPLDPGTYPVTVTNAAPYADASGEITVRAGETATLTLEMVAPAAPTNTPSATPTPTATSTRTLAPPTATVTPTTAPMAPVTTLPNTGAGPHATSPALLLLLTTIGIALLMVAAAGWRRRSS